MRPLRCARWARVRIKESYDGYHRHLQEIRCYEYVGEIVTLTVQARSIRIIPETRRRRQYSSHRVSFDRAEIGAARTKRSNEGRNCLGLTLRDPSFSASIFANLFND